MKQSDKIRVLSLREILSIVSLEEVLEMSEVTEEEALAFLIENKVVELPPFVYLEKEFYKDYTDQQNWEKDE